MAITVNRNPVTVNTSSKANRDYSQYFNHVQFKGLCSNQNVDTIDPSTFADVENLYVDSDDTLASRPKLVNHDNFGFKSIEKMWIWDDVHLIYGIMEVDSQEKWVLKDVHESGRPLLNEDNLKQIIRVENRIYIFFSEKVYVYEKVKDNYIFIEITKYNLMDYFYIPTTGEFNDGTFVKKEENLNELTHNGKIVLKENSLDNINNEVSLGSFVEFVLEGKEYKVSWNEYTSLTLGTPYIRRFFTNVRCNKTGACVAWDANIKKLFYSFDGSYWEKLPEVNNSKILEQVRISPDSGVNFNFSDSKNHCYFGISQDGKYVWVMLLEQPQGTSPRVDGYFIPCVISLTKDKLDPEHPDEPVKRYPDWTILYNHALLTCSLENDFNGRDFPPFMDMSTYNHWVLTYEYKYGINDDRYYCLEVGIPDGDEVSVKSYQEMQSTFRLQDARVYLTNYGMPDISGEIYLLVYSGLYGETWMVPFCIKGVDLVPYKLYSQTSPTFNLFNYGETSYNIAVGYIFGALTEMDLSISKKYITIFQGEDVLGEDDPYSYILQINWIAKKWEEREESGSKFKMYFNDFRILPKENSTPYFYWQEASLGINSTFLIPYNKPIGVKFVPYSEDIWLSRLGLIVLALNISINPYANQVYNTFIVSPSFRRSTIPIETKEDFSIYFYRWNLSGEYDYEDFYADDSVLAFGKEFTAFYLGGSENTIVANPLNQILTLEVFETDKYRESWTGLYPQHFVETNKTQYWSKDQTIYIEDRRYTFDWKPLLYFPEINTEIRPFDITNLLVIDRGVVALFNEYEVWYVVKDESTGGYLYYKSRVGLGCKEGADVDILYDGATITYGTPRGIIGMNYQQLTQNTDQILSFLSDNISTNYFAWYGDGKIKIFKYKFWVVFYKQNSYQCLVLDLRNGSWWYWNSKVEGGISSIYLYEDKPLLLDVNGQLMALDQGYTGVYGDLDTKIIDWKATSQPLAFGAINNYKQIKGININNVQLTKDPFNYILICRNYKNQKNLYLPKVVDFEQEKITVGSYRTFVKRLNYIQSVKFQYTIANNSDLPIQTPVSITAISTKYEIKGRVR